MQNIKQPLSNGQRLLLLCFLPVFAEIRQTECSGRLIFPLVSNGGKDQNNNCYDIGEHFVKFLKGVIAATGENQMKNIKSTEKEGGGNAYV